VPEQDGHSASHTELPLPFAKSGYTLSPANTCSCLRLPEEDGMELAKQLVEGLDVTYTPASERRRESFKIKGKDGKVVAEVLAGKGKTAVFFKRHPGSKLKVPLEPCNSPENAGRIALTTENLAAVRKAVEAVASK
jgi:hypothetical protein